MQICNRIFTAEDDLNKHLRTHNVPDALQPEAGVLKTPPRSNFFSPNTYLGLNEFLERPFELQPRTLKKGSKMEGRQQRRTVISIHSRIGTIAPM